MTRKLRRKLGEVDIVESYHVKYEPEVLDFLHSRNLEELKEAYGDLEKTTDPIEKKSIELLIRAAEKEIASIKFD